MNIELLIPPNPYLGDDKRNPPLGLLYLASVAEKGGYSVRINDLRGKNPEQFRAEIGPADIYGITASTPDYPLSLEIARMAKSINPASWTLLGGIHATSVPESIDNIFDKVVLGEGEISFMNILEDYKNKRNDKRFYQNQVIKNIDTIPFPARHLLPFDSVYSKNAFSVGGEYAGTLITSRGCSNKCSFCASPTMWGKGVRFRSPDNVVQELYQMIKRDNIRSFRFQDDTMTLRKDRLRELCTKIGPLGIKWRATTRVDQADTERLKIMKEAGCEELGYGIESLSQEVLDRNSKHITLEQVYRALDNTREAGLKSRLFFIIGLPGETLGFSDRLDSFLERTRPDGVDVSTLVLYPGCALFRNPSKYGLEIKENDYARYHMTLGLIQGEVTRGLTFKHDNLTEDQMIEERRKSLEIIKRRKAIKNF